jgi:hypothetical protein
VAVVKCREGGVGAFEQPVDREPDRLDLCHVTL